MEKPFIIKKYSASSLDKTPDLYHYTTGAGFKGIVESGCIHATNIRYLNDSQEFHFGLNYFSEAISRSRKISESDIHVPENIPIYDHLIELIFNECLPQFIDMASTYFVVSFSKNPDILSQWRAYGKNSVGYCIKFDYVKLLYPSDSMPEMILKVEYIDPSNPSVALEHLESIKKDSKAEFFKKMPWLEANDREEYKKMLKRMYELDDIEEGFPFLEEKDSYPHKLDITDTTPAWYREIMDFEFFVALPTLSNIAFSWKHHSFNEEGEYRMITNWSQRNFPESCLALRPKKFREANTYLIPYIEIPYDFKSTAILKEVIVGPGPHPSEAADSVRQFLAKNLTNVVEVTNSAIPFRFW